MELVKVCVIVAVATVVIHPKQMAVSRFALGLVLVCTIMLPIVDIIKENKTNLDNLPELVVPESNVSEDVISAAMERGLKEYISEIVGVAPVGISVSVVGIDTSSMKAEEIYVTLPRECVYTDYRALETRLANEFTNGGVCEVELDI